MEFDQKEETPFNIPEKKKKETAGNKPVNTHVPNTEKAREARRRASEYIKKKTS